MASPTAILVAPKHPCHDCQTLAPCALLMNHVFRCSCAALRYTGVTTVPGPRVIGLRAGNGASICWRCVEATTHPEQYIPDLPYIKGGVAPIMSDDSKYKDDAWCDECGTQITSLH